MFIALETVGQRDLVGAQPICSARAWRATGWILLLDSQATIKIIHSGLDSVVGGSTTELKDGRDKVAVDERGAAAQRLGRLSDLTEVCDVGV
ncbi:hypothetical protein A7X97_18685 [Stenotrophomonas sepilia]|nr:hypothetical protein A7X97_18685 [Stenotrophomonas sepilia]